MAAFLLQRVFPPPLTPVAAGVGGFPLLGVAPGDPALTMMAVNASPEAVEALRAELGLGARTLQRRLASEGHTFQETVDAARKDLAKRLLRETDYSLAEIAFLTGFAEQSAFTRAFKRWGGKTPRSYRISSRA